MISFTKLILNLYQTVNLHWTKFNINTISNFNYNKDIS